MLMFLVRRLNAHLSVYESSVGYVCCTIEAGVYVEVHVRRVMHSHRFAVRWSDFLEAGLFCTANGPRQGRTSSLCHWIGQLCVESLWWSVACTARSDSSRLFVAFHLLHYL